MRRLFAILATIAATSLAGCGQTGPLYLPDRPPPPKSSQDDEFDAQPPRPEPRTP